MNRFDNITTKNWYAFTAIVVQVQFNRNTRCGCFAFLSICASYFYICKKKNVKKSKNCRENKNLFIYCRAKSSFYTIRVDCLMACWCCLFSFISSFVSCTKMKLKYMCAYRRTAFFSFALHFCFFYYIRSDNYKILMCIHS